MKTHFIIGMILIICGCSPQSQPNEISPPPQNVSSADHVIVPADIDNTSQWTIEKPDVSAVEHSINALFAKPDKRMQGLMENIPQKAPFPLSDYYMRYEGVIKNGKKFIVGYGFHKSDSDPKEILKLPDNPNVRMFVKGWGGGSYFFTVVYNVTDKRLVELTYNAPL